MIFVLDFSVCKEANKCCLFSRLLTAVQVKYEKLIRRPQITVLQFATHICLKLQHGTKSNQNLINLQSRQFLSALRFVNV